MRITLYAINKR